MRRSFRDAIVGFSLVGGVVIFSGLTIWLKGLRFSSNTWNNIKANPKIIQKLERKIVQRAGSLANSRY